MIKEHDRIVFTVDLPDYQLQMGDIGTVVMMHQDGIGYEIEFFTANGKTFDVLTVEAGQLRSITGNERLHARPLNS